MDATTVVGPFPPRELQKHAQEALPGEPRSHLANEAPSECLVGYCDAWKERLLPGFEVTVCVAPRRTLVRERLLHVTGAIHGPVIGSHFRRCRASCEQSLVSARGEQRAAAGACQLCFHSRHDKCRVRRARATAERRKSKRCHPPDTDSSTPELSPSVSHPQSMQAARPLHTAWRAQLRPPGGAQQSSGRLNALTTHAPRLHIGRISPCSCRYRPLVAAASERSGEGKSHCEFQTETCLSLHGNCRPRSACVRHR